MRVLLDPRRPSHPGARVTAAELADLYAFPHRRWVRSNFVSTLDGSAVGADGLSGSINTPADNRVFALQRSLCQAVLVGAGTVRAEGYEFDRAGEKRDIRCQRRFPTGGSATIDQLADLETWRKWIGDGPVCRSEHLVVRVVMPNE